MRIYGHRASTNKTRKSNQKHCETNLSIVLLISPPSNDEPSGKSTAYPGQITGNKSGDFLHMTPLIINTRLPYKVFIEAITSNLRRRELKMRGSEAGNCSTGHGKCPDSLFEILSHRCLPISSACKAGSEGDIKHLGEIASTLSNICNGVVA